MSQQAHPHPYSSERRHLSLLEGVGGLSGSHRGGGRMLTWATAHQIANMAAAKAHAALSVDLSESQVDVVGAVHTSGAGPRKSRVSAVQGACDGSFGVACVVA